VLSAQRPIGHPKMVGLGIGRSKNFVLGAQLSAFGVFEKFQKTR
jgi:hypothetical protein